MTDSDPSAQPFPEILAGHQPRIYAFVFTLCADPHLAHDVLQEVNRTLWEKASVFDRERPFLPWALAIARNQVLAARKRQSRDRLTFDDAVVARLADRASERSEQVDQRQIALASCMERLAEPQRSLIERRYVSGDSIREIASALSRSVNVVAVTLHRVRQTLARCIERALESAASA